MADQAQQRSAPRRIWCRILNFRDRKDEGSVAADLVLIIPLLMLLRLLIVATGPAGRCPAAGRPRRCRRDRHRI